MGRAGIFVLRNTTTGEQYVGQSKDIDNQRKKQDSLMRNGRHYNSYIQQDYNSGYRFSFSVLEYCSPSQLNQRKNYWIRQLNTFNNGYNQTGRNRNTYSRMSRNTYSSYSPSTRQTQQTPKHINLINQIKNSDKIDNSTPPQEEDNEAEKKLLKDKLEKALDKYNRRFDRIGRFLKLRYIILFLIIIYIFPPIVANLLLIIFAILWLGIFLAKNEYNSCVDELKKYGVIFEKMDHTTIKALNILWGTDLRKDFGKPREDISSNKDTENKEDVDNTKKDFKWNICPSCNHMLNSVAKKCPYCGYIFEE